MDENFIAIKFEVIGVNFVACVSCQNGSGSPWLKLIGLSQTQTGIKALLSCNKQILDQEDKIMIACSVEDKADPAAHCANVTNARNVNTRHWPLLTISHAPTNCNSQNPDLISSCFLTLSLSVQPSVCCV